MTVLSIIAIILTIGITLFILGIIKSNKIIKYIGLSILILIAILCGYIFYIENGKLFFETKVIVPQNDLLPTADRIIYKDDNSNYYVCTPKDKLFNTLFSEISYRVDMISTSQNITDEEIEDIKNNGKFIELDYNTKSKNKIFPLEEKEIGMINMKDSGGQIVKRGLVDKNDFIKIFEKNKKHLTQSKFEEGQIYTSINTFPDLKAEQISGFISKRNGIYQRVVSSDEELEEVCKKYDFLSNDIKVENIDFDEKNVVVIVTYYNINKIEEKIGSLRFYFKDLSSNYNVNLYVTSKIPNINCIYCEIEDTNNGNNNYHEKNIEYNSVNKGIIKNISNNTIEIVDSCGNTKCIIGVNSETRTINFTHEKDKEMEFNDIKVGDSIYVQGMNVESENQYSKIDATDLYVYKKENLKKYFENQLKDGYRIDGYSFPEVNIDSYGNGYIILELELYEGQKDFIYPIKVNVNSKTENYLGMGRHLQSNYGYHKHEICDITLDKKIIDIDNIEGTAKMIEYIAD